MQSGVIAQQRRSLQRRRAPRTIVRLDFVPRNGSQGGRKRVTFPACIILCELGVVKVRGAMHHESARCSLRSHVQQVPLKGRDCHRAGTYYICLPPVRMRLIRYLACHTDNVSGKLGRTYCAAPICHLRLSQAIWALSELLPTRRAISGSQRRQRDSLSSPSHLTVHHDVHRQARRRARPARCIPT